MSLERGSRKKWSHESGNGQILECLSDGTIVSMGTWYRGECSDWQLSLKESNDICDEEYGFLCARSDFGMGPTVPVSSH